MWCYNLFQESGKVTHNLTLQTSKRSSAVASEKEAYVTVFESAREIFNLRSVTNDGNISIRAYMREQAAVKHGLDVWHLCENLAKNLAKKAKLAVCIIHYKVLHAKICGFVFTKIVQTQTVKWEAK